MNTFTKTILWTLSVILFLLALVSLGAKMYVLIVFFIGGAYLISPIYSSGVLSKVGKTLGIIFAGFLFQAIINPPAPDESKLANSQTRQQKDIVKAETPLAVPKIITPQPVATKKEIQNDLRPLCKLQGKVINVSDGDTVTILDKQRQKYMVRLAGIDAPEIGQPYGKKAKKYLSALVKRKIVCVDWYKKDKYSRLVGVVKIDDEDINFKMVTPGLAWHFKKFESEQSQEDREKYAHAQKVAKQATLGLWSEPHAINPDDWRAGARPEKLLPVNEAVKANALMFARGMP